MERMNFETDLKLHENRTAYARILHQPSKYYRMRYEAENRKSFLFSDENNVILNERDPESINGFFPQIEVSSSFAFATSFEY